MEHLITTRDRSACVSRLRVPTPGGDGLMDEWLEHRFLREGEKEFPIRNEQVRASLLSLIWLTVSNIQTSYVNIWFWCGKS